MDNHSVVCNCNAVFRIRFKMIVQGTIKSKGVTDGSLVNLPYTSVVVKGTTKGTTANGNGFFSIDAPVGSILRFSQVGHIPVEKMVLIGNSVINVVLEEEMNMIDTVEVNFTRKPKSKGWLWVVGGLALASFFLIKPENPKKVTIK